MVIICGFLYVLGVGIYDIGILRGEYDWEGLLLVFWEGVGRFFREEFWIYLDVLNLIVILIIVG